jgi:beta-lactamase regulating signal transducer with metallopeptidase domain
MSGLLDGLAHATLWLITVATQEMVFSTVVFFVVITLCWLLRGRAPSLQYGLWSLVLVRLVLPTDLCHPLSAGELLSRLLPVASVDEAAFGTDKIFSIGSTVVLGDTGWSGTTSSAPTWSLLVAGLWLLGVLLWSARYYRRLCEYKQVVRNATPVADTSLLAIMVTWKRRLHLHRQVRLVTTEVNVSPFTTGLLQPVVVIPQIVLTSGNNDLIEASIAHELVHVARWDSLWQRLQHLIHGVFFFHPVVWVTGARLHHERERICDTTVLSFGTLSEKAYAGSILDVMQLRLSGVEAPALGTPKRRLHMRVRSIIDHPHRRPRSWLAAVMVAGVGLLLLPMAGTGAMPDQGAGMTPAVAASPAQVPDQETGEVNLANPLPGAKVSASYGPMRSPWSEGKTIRHRGIDLATKLGTPVLAAAAGLVEVATEDYEPSPGSGTVVILGHGDGVKTVYTHLGKLSVQAGDRVERGDKIAEVGNTGKSTGPHLHFEIWKQESHVDPATLITF